MNNKPFRSLLAEIALFAGLAFSQVSTTPQSPPPQPTSLPGAESRVYKNVGDTQLMLHIFQPAERKAGERLPAIIFFFGGGWMGGRVDQFAPQSKYLAERGMAAIVADYRVGARHGTTPMEGVADAKSAIRWVRMHAAELSIDDKRIVAAGGSSGGHLAACTALSIGIDEKNEDLKISSVPNALVLFNPALDFADLIKGMPADKFTWIHDISDRAMEISPLHNVNAGAPPTVIFHGTADTAVPFEQSASFCEVMKKQGNRCEIAAFEGRPHSFFNYGQGDNADYRETLRKTDEFLISLKYLKGEPTIK
jgi:acetyl esterase/lipase